MFSILFDIVICCDIFGDEILQLIFTIFGGMTMEEQYDFYNPYEDVDFLRKSRKEENQLIN